jgi:hypothetical protein
VLGCRSTASPPVTVLGLSVSDVGEATDTVSVVVLVVPYDAVIVTDVEDATPLVVIMLLDGICSDHRIHIRQQQRLGDRARTRVPRIPI